MSLTIQVTMSSIIDSKKEAKEAKQAKQAAEKVAREAANEAKKAAAKAAKEAEKAVKAAANEAKKMATAAANEAKKTAAKAVREAKQAVKEAAREATSNENRTKKNTKKNEEIDVNALIHYLNTKESVKGQEMRDAFKARFGLTIIGATRHKTLNQVKQKRGGGRSIHYDFVVQLDDGTERTVEHKGSKDKKTIDLSLPPWTGGVQFYNGGMEKYRLAQKHAREWYHKFIVSGVLTERYGLTSPIPSEEEWITKDAKVQSLAKTPFGKELKKVYQERDGCEKGSLKAERDEFVQGFEWSEEDVTHLAEDVFPLIQSSFADKDVWLQIAGSVESGDFNFAWRDPIHIQKMERITIEKKTDIEFTVECDGGLVVHGILRWGYGQGFSNLRIDLK
jgi:hypothetical protein